MKLLATLTALCLTLASTAQAEYLVNETPDSRYIMSDDGTVTDLDTGLMWMRCNLGQTWNTTTKVCDETPTTYSWQEAFEGVAAYTDTNYTNWRLPNINELRTIAAYDVSAPAINGVAFPNTPSSLSLCSSTPDTLDGNKSWVMTMEKGDDMTAKRIFSYSVKLVRNLH